MYHDKIIYILQGNRHILKVQRYKRESVKSILTIVT